MRLFFLLTVTLPYLLTGCNISPPKYGEDYPRYAISFADTTKAIVLVSTHAIDECDPWRSTAIQIFHQNASSSERIPVKSFGINSNGVRSDFKKMHGFAIAMQFDPGEYKLKLYTMRQNLTLAGSPRYTKPDLGTFRLKAGQVVYFGAFKSAGCGNILLSVQDEWADVASEFSRLYPELILQSVEIQPFQLKQD